MVQLSVIWIHRRRKKRSGENIKPEYRLELEKVNATMAEVVDKEVAPVGQKSLLKAEIS